MSADEIHNALIEFVKDVGIPLRTLSQFSGSSAKDILDFWSGRRIVFLRRHLESLCLNLGITVEDMVNKTYSRQTVCARIFSNPTALPEKYAHGSLSHARTCAHMVEMHALLNGRARTNDFLLKMGVVPAFFNDLDNPANLQLVIDLLKLLVDSGVKDYDLLARGMILTMDDTPLCREFKKARNHEEFYWLLAEHIAMFDQNFKYHFEISRNQLVLRCYPSEKYLHYNDGQVMTSKELFQYRVALIAQIPILGGLIGTSIVRRKCISQGDDYTEDILDFPHLGRFDDPGAGQSYRFLHRT